MGGSAHPQSRRALTLRQLPEMHAAGDEIAPPRFVRNFMADSSGIADAVRRHVHAVKDGSFPDSGLHGY